MQDSRRVDFDHKYVLYFFWNKKALLDIPAVRVGDFDNY